MPSLTRAATLAVLVVAACTADSTSPTAPAGRRETISDAAHAGSVPGFYFLPPLVTNPSFGGTFDASLQPRVEVCELSGADCGTLVATFTFGTGSSSVRAGGDHYIVNWHTGDFDLDPARFYRISVFQDAFRLGYADVDVVAGGSELKNVDTGQFIALLDGRTLPIKFRVETNTAPVAGPDIFQAIGNVTIPVDAPGVLANDSDSESPPGVVPGTVATASGGTATLAADGSFTYLSAPGFTGTDSFFYTASDGRQTATGSVTMQVPEVVWYVDNTASAPGDGRDVSPFTELVSAQLAAADSQDILVMYGDGTSSGYDAGYTFKPGQSLYGQGIPVDQADSLNGRNVVVLAAGSAPTVTNKAAGPTLQLAYNSDVRGLIVTSTAGPGIAGSNLGTFWALSVAVAAVGGPSLDLEDGLLETSFSSLSSANSPDAGLRLVRTTGTLTAPAGMVTNAAVNGVVVSGGNSDVAYGGSISGGGRAVFVSGFRGTFAHTGNIDNTGTGILAQNDTAATIAFNGSSKSLSTGTAQAVTLLNNPGSTVNFGGGGLVITTTTGTGFGAARGGTVTITGVDNTVASAGGTAVLVENTPIGGAGLSFLSVSASGGTNGIVLRNTGAVNGMQVTGSGGSASGGTIQNTSGPGVSLRGVRNVWLSHMVISGADSSGIAGGEVNGFALTSSTVSGNGDAPGEAGVAFAGLLGTASVDGSVITGSASDNLRVQTSGTLALRVAGSTISSNGASGGGDGVRVEARGSASVAVDVSGSTFSASRGDHFRAHASDGAHLDVAFTGNVLSGGHASAVGQGVRIGTTGSGAFTGSVSYDVADNTINGAIADAVRAELGPSTAAAAFAGSVRGNVIGTAGVPTSCSAQGSGISVIARGQGTHTAAVTGNTLRRCLIHGIATHAADGAGTLNLTVTGNTVSEMVEPASREGFALDAGLSNPADGHTVCLSLGGAGSLANALTHGASGSADYRLSQRFATTVRLPEYEDAPDDTGAVAAFVSARNGSASGNVQATVPSGGGYVGVAACPQP